MRWMFAELKSEILRLLREDEEFRYAVAGLIGLEEILKRLGSLTEEQTKIWEEVRGLREEQVNLRKDFNRMLEVVKELQEGYKRLERRMESLESAMVSGFRDVSRFAGLTFEEFVRRFLTASLRRAGEIPSDAELRRATIDGEEVDIFLEEPLIVGEVTAYAETVDEIWKLLRKAEAVKARYGREPRKILVMLTVCSEALEGLRKVADERGVQLIIGKTV